MAAAALLHETRFGAVKRRIAARAAAAEARTEAYNRARASGMVPDAF